MPITTVNLLMIKEHFELLCETGLWLENPKNTLTRLGQFCGIIILVLTSQEAFHVWLPMTLTLVTLTLTYQLQVRMSRVFSSSSWVVTRALLIWWLAKPNSWNCANSFRYTDTWKDKVMIYPLTTRWWVINLKSVIFEPCHRLISWALPVKLPLPVGLTETHWRYTCVLTLAQVMAWCLPAPRHYLNQR